MATGLSGGGLFGMADPIGSLMGYRGGMSGKTGSRFAEETYGPAREMSERAASMSTYQLPTVNTGFGGYSVGPNGEVTTNLDPRFSSQSGALLGQSQNLLGQAGQAYQALGAFDPMQAAKQQYALMESVLGPERARQQEAMQNQLYAQGRLGSTGGSITEQAFNQATQAQQAQNLYNAYMQAQQSQQNLAALGQGMFGTALRGIGAAGQIEQMPLSALGYGMQYGGALQGGRQAGADYLMRAALGQSDTASQYGLDDLANMHDFGMTSYKMWGGGGGMD